MCNATEGVEISLILNMMGVLECWRVLRATHKF